MAAAVIVDPAAFAGFAEDGDNYLILVRVRPGQPFVYYSGAAWDRGGIAGATLRLRATGIAMSTRIAPISGPSQFRGAMITQHPWR